MEIRFPLGPQFNQDPTTYGRTRDWLKAVELATTTAQPRWRVTIERVAAASGDIRASIGSKASALIVPLFTPTMRALTAMRRLSVSPKKPKEQQPPSLPGAPRNASRLHFGDNSIEGESASGTPEVGRPAEQNVIRWLCSHATQNSVGMGFDDTGRVFRFVSPLVVPDVQAGGRLAEVASEFAYWTPSHAFSCAITTVNGHSVGCLNNTLAAPYLIGLQAWDTGKVASALVGQTDLTVAMCKAIAPVFALQLEQFDNTSLYAKGWYLMFLRHAMATNDAGYVPTWAPPGEAFVLRTWIVEGLAESFRADVTARRFIVDVTNWSSVKISCLAHIARAGAPLVRIPGVENPYAAGVSWFAVDIAAYSPVVWGDYRIRDFSAHDMFIVLRAIGASVSSWQHGRQRDGRADDLA